MTLDESTMLRLNTALLFQIPTRQFSLYKEEVRSHSALIFVVSNLDLFTRNPREA